MTDSRTEMDGDRGGRLARADTLVKDHMLMSAAAGLIPAPGVDLLAGVGIQIALVKRLTSLYGVPFSDNAARGIIMSLLGGIGGGALAGGLALSTTKLIPGIGTVFGAWSMPVAIAAATYAVGKVFIAHLETGGTLADFNATANRRYFRDLVRRGRETAAHLTTPSPEKDAAKP